MILYHYTSARHLRAIARHGLTVGDVPTDIRRGRGRVGVWFTSAATAGGHGLEGSAVNKKQYRLAVEIPDDSPLLVRWSDWAPKNATAETIGALHSTAAEHEGEGPASWYVFFGVLQPAAISSCVETTTGAEVDNWGEVSPPEMDIKAVPAWRRDAWHRQLIKQVDRALKSASDTRNAIRLLCSRSHSGS